jgi:hypothetical protein
MREDRPEPRRRGRKGRKAQLEFDLEASNGPNKRPRRTTAGPFNKSLVVKVRLGISRLIAFDIDIVLAALHRQRAGRLLDFSDSLAMTPEHAMRAGRICRYRDILRCAAANQRRTTIQKRCRKRGY